MFIELLTKGLRQKTKCLFGPSELGWEFGCLYLTTVVLYHITSLRSCSNQFFVDVLKKS